MPTEVVSQSRVRSPSLAALRLSSPKGHDEGKIPQLTLYFILDFILDFLQ